MRVFLCGAQGTGKSTLVMSLPHRFFLEKKDSFSKKFLTKDSSAQRSTSDNFEEFQDKILLHCLAEYVGGTNFIASRSIIDSLAYLEVNKAKKRKVLTAMIENYKKYLLTENDIYIYLPIEFELTKDGNSVRDTDIEYQQKVDESIRRNFYKLKALNTPAVFIKATGTVEERMSKIKRAIIGSLRKKEREASMQEYREKIREPLKKNLCSELVTRRL
jgi:GTPase SAR1 family protein